MTDEEYREKLRGTQKIRGALTRQKARRKVKSDYTETILAKTRLTEPTLAGSAKGPEANAGSVTQKATPVSTASASTKRPTTATFSSAFKAAYAGGKGKGTTFEWKGKKFRAVTKEDVSRLKTTGAAKPSPSTPAVTSPAAKVNTSPGPVAPALHATPSPVAGKRPASSAGASTAGKVAAYGAIAGGAISAGLGVIGAYKLGKRGVAAAAGKFATASARAAMARAHMAERETMFDWKGEKEVTGTGYEAAKARRLLRKTSRVEGEIAPIRGEIAPVKAKSQGSEAVPAAAKAKPAVKSSPVKMVNVTKPSAAANITAPAGGPPKLPAPSRLGTNERLDRLLGIKKVATVAPPKTGGDVPATKTASDVPKPGKPQVKMVSAGATPEPVPAQEGANKPSGVRVIRRRKGVETQISQDAQPKAATQPSKPATIAPSSPKVQGPATSTPQAAKQTAQLDLKKLGYTPAQIGRMKPETATEVLKKQLWSSKTSISPSGELRIIGKADVKAAQPTQEAHSVASRASKASGPPKAQMVKANPPAQPATVTPSVPPKPDIKGAPTSKGEHPAPAQTLSKPEPAKSPDLEQARRKVKKLPAISSEMEPEAVRAQARARRLAPVAKVLRETGPVTYSSSNKAKLSKIAETKRKIEEHIRKKGVTTVTSEGAIARLPAGVARVAQTGMRMAGTFGRYAGRSLGKTTTKYGIPAAIIAGSGLLGAKAAKAEGESQVKGAAKEAGLGVAGLAAFTGAEKLVSKIAGRGAAKLIPGAGLALSISDVAPTVAEAAKTGYGAFKARREAQKEAAGSAAKYGTVEAATATRKRLVRRKQ